MPEKIFPLKEIIRFFILKSLHSDIERGKLVSEINQKNSWVKRDRFSWKALNYPYQLSPCMIVGVEHRHLKMNEGAIHRTKAMNHFLPQAIVYNQPSCPWFIKPYPQCLGILFQNSNGLMGRQIQVENEAGFPKAAHGYWLIFQTLEPNSIGDCRRYFDKRFNGREGKEGCQQQERWRPCKEQACGL